MYESKYLIYCHYLYQIKIFLLVINDILKPVFSQLMLSLRTVNETYISY